MFLLSSTFVPVTGSTMLCFLVLLVCVGAALAAPQKSSHEAAIIKESRYLNTAGQFGASYSQEDGVEFNEEADSEGNRKGSYTYIDPNGQRKTITYTAGKDGFQATGDHLPVAPPVPANPFPVPGLPQLNVPINYQVQSQLSTPPSNSLQIQYQSLPVPGSPLLNIFHLQPVPVVSSTELPPVSLSPRHYPPGKLNVKQTADGFSYTFNSIV